jgi:hypothetical protein
VAVTDFLAQKYPVSDLAAEGYTAKGPESSIHNIADARGILSVV